MDLNVPVLEDLGAKLGGRVVVRADGLLPFTDWPHDAFWAGHFTLPLAELLGNVP